MIKGLILLFYTSCMISGQLYAQETPAVAEQQLENHADEAGTETEDDTYLQEMEHFRKHPLNLNTAGAEELRQLRILTDMQVTNLLSYRQLLGRLVHIYELQAIPGWDLSTIRKLIPFITVAVPLSLQEESKKRFGEGAQQLLWRVSQVLERAAGFASPASGAGYKGSPQRVFFRYRYQYKNLLQFGCTGDKDAGEPFGKGKQAAGFDFYSAHFFIRKLGMVHTLALGDFTVNMGQGLVHWQGLAFRKSAELTGIKRQSASLRPYSSAGEFYFHRGAGLTLQKGKWEGTLFASVRKLDGNRVRDSISGGEFISSFLTSGYHRTAAELEDRNRVRQTTLGGILLFREKDLQLGLNHVLYRFSLPLQKRDEPYNRYAISGSHWYNTSFDFSYTRRNLHVFGEAALDRKGQGAWVSGLLLSVDPRADLSFFYRRISKSYQSLYGNAFTENTLPSNEEGIFAAICLRPAPGWRIDAYSDLFRFPWLKYQVDAPGRGKDFLLQVTYTPNKQVELYSRFRSGTRERNKPGDNAVTGFPVPASRQNWRTHINYKVSRAVTLRNRVELVWYDQEGAGKSAGFLGFADILYKPMMRPFSFAGRFQYFESGSYDTRIYAYENDVQYSYSIPSFSGRGYRYYTVLQYDLSRSLTAWVRWSRTVFINKSATGSGLDEIDGNKKTQLTLQCKWSF